MLATIVDVYIFRIFLVLIVLNLTLVAVASRRQMMALLILSAFQFCRVRVYDWPLPQDIPPCFELAVHASPVTALVVTPDDNFLFTCGEDGSVFVLGIKVFRTKIFAMISRQRYKTAQPQRHGAQIQFFCIRVPSRCRVWLFYTQEQARKAYSLFFLVQHGPSLLVSFPLPDRICTTAFNFMHTSTP